MVYNDLNLNNFPNWNFYFSIHYIDTQAKRMQTHLFPTTWKLDNQLFPELFNSLRPGDAYMRQ